jgi:hypothetical protein
MLIRLTSLKDITSSTSRGCWVENTITLTVGAAKIGSSTTEAILAAAIGSGSANVKGAGVDLFHVFKGHVFPDGAASLPHSATASQFDVHPVPQ